MRGTRKLDAILDRAAQAHAKVVLVGDDKQLQAVLQAGGGFRALRQRLGASELTVNRRQRDPLDRQALELIRDGKGEQALNLYGAGGRLTFAPDQATADQAMLRDWWASFSRGEAAVILALTREDAARLNDQARQVLRADGRLGSDTFQVRDREFSTGDRIVCRKNWRPLGVANGTRARVEGLDHAKGELLIKTDEGQHLTLPAFYPAKEGTAGGPAIDHSYAVTGHKSQGMTVDRVFVRGGGALSSEWAYTTMSRVRISADLRGAAGGGHQGRGRAGRGRPGRHPRADGRRDEPLRRAGPGPGQPRGPATTPPDHRRAAGQTRPARPGPRAGADVQGGRGQAPRRQAGPGRGRPPRSRADSDRRAGPPSR